MSAQTLVELELAYADSRAAALTAAEGPSTDAHLDALDDALEAADALITGYQVAAQRTFNLATAARQNAA